MPASAALWLLSRRAQWPQRLGAWLLALFALSPSCFAGVLPRSFIIEDTLPARIANSLHYMYYGIGGPLLQLRASVAYPEGRVQFREHILLASDKLNLLFTTSPLYPVELPTAEPPRTLNIDDNTYEGWAGVNASEQYTTPQLLKAELAGYEEYAAKVRYRFVPYLW